MRPREMYPQGIKSPKGVPFGRFSNALFCLIFLLTGCGGMPSGGPRSGSFDSHKEHAGSSSAAETEESLPFALVDVERKIIELLAHSDDASYFKGAFTDRRPPADITIGVGDTIRVTIFEAGSGGLFVPTNGTLNSGNSVSIPDQEVDQRGAITIPYADKNGDGGLIKVHNRRPVEVQNEIRDRLMDRAIEPQVIVTLVNRTSNLYSVIGDVNNPGRFSLSQSGIRILDALGAAGGPKGTDYNTFVTLQRGTTSATVRLSTLLAESDNNIFVQPGDVLALKREDRYYNVLGATQVNNRIPFDAEKVSLADALAKAGGLNGELAAPSTVVVFRREEQKTLESMGVKIASFKDETGPIPTVYRFNFSQPAGMFLAQKMQLRGDDVVYVSSHPFNDASKLLTILRDVLVIKLIDD